MTKLDESIDNSQECIFVHYDVPVSAARQQARIWGFRKIRSFRRDGGPFNGNEARALAIISAKRHKNKYYFKGNYDQGATVDSTIFRFSYGEYVGELVNGPASSKFEHHAAWSGHE